MAHKHKHLVPIFATQTPPPTQWTLTFELCMAPVRYRRLRWRGVDLLPAARQVRVRLAFGLRDLLDFAGLDVDHALQHLDDLGEGRRSASAMTSTGGMMRLGKYSGGLHAPMGRGQGQHEGYGERSPAVNAARSSSVNECNPSF